MNEFKSKTLFPIVIRTERGEDAGTAVSDQQVRPATAGYPVDRYLVESSKKIDVVNLIDDGIWNPEPMMSPEDEIILRKLHDMLQSTADDLKLLSGELSKYHEPGVQVKTLPMPLDEEFNEKIHIEEIVNAKFHGYKLVDSTPSSPNVVQKKTNNKVSKGNDNKTKKLVDSSVQVNYMPTLKKHTLRRNLGVSRTKIVQIDEMSKEDNDFQGKHNTLSNKKSPTVVYNELSYKYVEPKMPSSLQRPLQIQDMPSINIRSELTKQKVLQLDIIPDNQEICKNSSLPSNALVLTMQHKTAPRQRFDKLITFDRNQLSSTTAHGQPTVRKVSKMSTCGSSESTNNNSSDSQQKENQRHYIRTSPKVTSVANFKSKNVGKKEPKRSGTHLEEWKKKLNAVYGRQKPSTTFKTKKSPKTTPKALANQSNFKKDMNNSEYIPYSKLTLGGVSVSDIEREIRDIPNRNEIIISPILDKILSSRENSFHNESPRRKQSPKVLTTSDENLLQEVIDIEYQVTNTLSSKVKKTNKSSGNNQNTSKENKESDSYVDDFEDDQSEESPQIQSNKSQPAPDIEPSFNNSLNEEENINNSHENTHNKTYTKTTNLSFKNAVDVFEFVHSIDTHDTGTQSNPSNKITPKETQTSPRNDQRNQKPIHNDLWPSIDSNKEVERMFNLEKDFIKKLILEEYGDMIDKNLNKPSTSKSDLERNEAAFAKNTQTSPAHVKSVMTSPNRTKTRTTSPFALSVTVNQQTSPMVVSKQEDFNVEIEDDELGISVNLSSPRFSLRLPQSSREVLSNFEASRNNKEMYKEIHFKKSSSSSLNEDYSSSDISSLGQISNKLKRKLRKNRIPSISELSSSLSLSDCSSARSGTVVPLKSEGEASVGQTMSKKSNKTSRSEGEMSLGQYN